jgi:hypothetical protein
MSPNGPKDITKIFIEGKLVDKALKSAVREALLRHKQAGLPVVVHRKGKTVWIPAEKIRLDRCGKRRGPAAGR